MRANTEPHRKILIVEDEGDICLLFNIILSGKCTEIDHVNNLTAAIDYLEKESPALILLDNQLPDGTGHDFINYLKVFHPSVRVMMISGFKLAARKVLENNNDLLLQRSFALNEAYSSIEAFLN